MATHRLEIPGWQPALANVLLRCHWRQRARLRREDDEAVALAARLQGVPRATGRRRASLVLVLGPRQRKAPDPDGPVKSTLDALVNAGLLTGDSAAGVEWGGTRFERGVRGSVIELEDLE